MQGYWITFFGLVVLAGYIQAYTNFYQLDTSDGFCETELYGRIQVGETAYFERRCERLTCGPGYLDVAGCSKVQVPRNNPKCHLVGERGTYPTCCPKLEC